MFHTKWMLIAYLNRVRLLAADNARGSNSAADWARRTFLLRFLRNEDLNSLKFDYSIAFQSMAKLVFFSHSFRTEKWNWDNEVKEDWEYFGRVKWQFAYLDGRIWQKRSWPVVSSSFGWSFSSAPARRFIDEYKLNILNDLTFFVLATSHTRPIIFRLLLYTEFMVLYTNIDTDRGGDW